MSELFLFSKDSAGETEENLLLQEEDEQSDKEMDFLLHDELIHLGKIKVSKYMIQITGHPFPLDLIDGFDEEFVVPVIGKMERLPDKEEHFGGDVCSTIEIDKLIHIIGIYGLCRLQTGLDLPFWVLDIDRQIVDEVIGFIDALADLLIREKRRGDEPALMEEEHALPGREIGQLRGEEQSSEFVFLQVEIIMERGELT